MDYVIVTSGSTYLDIDAYACCVALTDLLKKNGINAIAYSTAVFNYSICDSLTKNDALLCSNLNELPSDCDLSKASFIVVDVSNPSHMESIVDIDRIIEVYDHHSGFESFWNRKIGECAKISFIGAAATLIYQKWENEKKADQIPAEIAKLLVAAILDNTLNLKSSNTTEADRKAIESLINIGQISKEWCDNYFLEVQNGIERDLKVSILRDIKQISENSVLPPIVGQVAVWDATKLLEKIEEITLYMDEFSINANGLPIAWLLNVIDIKSQHSYFVCNQAKHKEAISKIFCTSFENNVAKLPKQYLRKEIMKRVEKGETENIHQIVGYNSVI